MQLSLHSEYALRVLIYLGAHPERIASAAAISQAYGISKHHLVRVIQTLAEQGFVEIRVGRSGGVMLALDPGRIRLGEVVRAAEPNLRLAECFEGRTNTCPIAPVCALKGMLNEALHSFLTALNRYTLADVLDRGGPQKLASVFTVLAAGPGRDILQKSS